jgi:2-dehydropantoate 2-reductase
VTTNTGAIAGTRVAVMGAGAVGSYFGGMLARAGAKVTLIGRAAHAEAIRRDGGLFIDSVAFQERVALEAATDASGVKGAEFVLFCVKTVNNEEAAKELKPHLAPGAVVMSLQNGVDNVERIREAAGIDALPLVVYVAAAMPEPGRVKHSGRGDLIAGELKGSAHGPARAERVAALFAGAGVPCRVSANIETDLWIKLVMNCAGNAVSALARSSYGRAAKEPKTRELMRRTIEETVAVARALGVSLPNVDLVETGLKLAETLGDATSSTAQDIARGKRTEIASLNGYVMRRGAELKIATPVNTALDGLVTLLEQSAAREILEAHVPTGGTRRAGSGQ